MLTLLNRRAQLRDCLEVLRQHVPLPDKLTTLALLQSAKKYIEVCVSLSFLCCITRLCPSLPSHRCALQSLQKKEREENEIKMKLEHEQSILISKLVEMGAAGFISSTTSRSTPPPGTTPTEIAAPNEGIPLGLTDNHLQLVAPSPKDSGSHEGWLLEVQF